MLTFGYDKVVNEDPITNGFKFTNNISPINLGFAGYVIKENITDYEILNPTEINTEIKHTTHFINLTNFFEILIKQVDEITEKYFYIIDVFTHDFWEDENAKNISISKQAVNDIKNKKSKMLILFPGESLHLHVDSIKVVDAWIKKYDLPKESVIFVDGNYKGYANHSYVNYISYSIWEHVFHKIHLLNENLTEIFRNAIIERKSRKKVYLNYNRRLRYHRSKFVYYLKQEDILKHGLVSLGRLTTDNIHDYHINLGDIPDSFFDDLPLTFDDIDLEINHVEEIIQHDFLNSFISVISETTVEEDNLFPTEKTWRPIVALHPFMIISAPGFLKMLHSFGYKTFSKWFDESYDEEPDLSKRLSLIINELKKLILKSEDELKDMLVDMLPTLEYNFNNYLKRSKSNEFQIQLENELWK